MRRGEVWWIRFPAPNGCAALTQTIRQLPVEVPLGPEDGIRRRSVANADSLATVPKSDVLDYLTTLSPEKLRTLEQAIKFSLALP